MIITNKFKLKTNWIKKMHQYDVSLDSISLVDKFKNFSKKENFLNKNSFGKNLRIFQFLFLSSHAITDIYTTNYISILTHMALVTVILAILFATINYIFSFFLYFLKSDANKTAYECGFEPFDESMRHPFDIHFYVVGILFLIFDLEISCLVPATFNIGNNNYETIVIIALFLIIVTIGFVLEYNIGALDWFSLKSKQLPGNIWYILPIIKYDKFDYLLDLDLTNLPYKYKLYEVGIPMLLNNFKYISIFNILLIFIYIIISIFEASTWHYINKFNKVNNYINYYKIKFRLLVVLTLTILITILYLIFYPNSVFCFYNNNIIINCTGFGFQLMLSYLIFFTFKQSKRIFFQIEEQFLLFPIFFLSNFFFLILLLVAGSLTIVLITIIGINLGLYVLLFNNYQRMKLESGLKYFFLSITVVIMLYLSVIIIYAITSTMNLLFIADIMGDILSYDQSFIGIVYIFVLCVFFFKTGIFPSNFFLPEIYKGLSNFLFIYITLPLKAAFFAFLIKFCEIVVYTGNYNWCIYILYIIILFSFLIGPLGAITATDLYQFFAYISVTQLGWLLLGLIIYQEKNAVILYYFYYFLLSSIFVFILTKEKSARWHNNSLVNFINKKREVKIDILLMCVFLTLTGLPPTAGFIPKLYILLVTFLEGFWVLAVFAIISSIFSGYYYIRIAYLLFIKFKDISRKDFDNKVEFGWQIWWMFIIIIISLYIITYFYFPHAFL